MLKTWKGEEANVQIAQEALLKRASANSAAQLGKYDPSGESAEAAKGMFEKGYQVRVLPACTGAAGAWACSRCASDAVWDNCSTSRLSVHAAPLPAPAPCSTEHVQHARKHGRLQPPVAS